jgi:hypothetical protein
MRLDNCELRAQFTGRLINRLTRGEAESMVRAGTATRTGARRYTLVQPVRPSSSKIDPCSLRSRDMHVVVGLSKPTFLLGGELLLDLEGDGIGVHLVRGSGIAENLRRVLPRCRWRMVSSTNTRPKCSPRHDGDRRQTASRWSRCPWPS